MRRNPEPGERTVHGSVRLHLGRAKVRLLAHPSPASIQWLDYLLQKALEHYKLMVFADAREAGVAGYERFAQV
jgi:hypothetical protein